MATKVVIPFLISHSRSSQLHLHYSGNSFSFLDLKKNVGFIVDFSYFCLISSVIGWLVALGHLDCHPFSWLWTQWVMFLVHLLLAFHLWSFYGFDLHYTSLKSLIYLSKRLFSSIDHIACLVFGKIVVSLVWKRFSFWIFHLLENRLSRNFFIEVFYEKLILSFHEKYKILVCCINMLR